MVYRRATVILLFGTLVTYEYCTRALTICICPCINNVSTGTLKLIVPGATWPWPQDSNTPPSSHPGNAYHRLSSDSQLFCLDTLPLWPSQVPWFLLDRQQFGCVSKGMGSFWGVAETTSDEGDNRIKRTMEGLVSQGIPSEVILYIRQWLTSLLNIELVSLLKQPSIYSG